MVRKPSLKTFGFSLWLRVLTPQCVAAGNTLSKPTNKPGTVYVNRDCVHVRTCKIVTPHSLGQNQMPTAHGRAPYNTLDWTINNEPLTSMDFLVLWAFLPSVTSALSRFFAGIPPSFYWLCYFLSILSKLHFSYSWHFYSCRLIVVFTST